MMKVIKPILIILAVLIVIPLVVAIFVDKDFSVEREIVIDRPKDEVFNYIKYLKNQDNYSKWAKMDPAMKKYYRGSDGTVGFVSGWESNVKDVGSGEQQIKNIAEGEKIEMSLLFKEPFESKAAAYMTTSTISPTQTKVKWGFNGSMVYPTNFMKLVMNMDEMVGNDLSTGLNNLKSILENKQ
jgi:hypothetical protein